MISPLIALMKDQVDALRVNGISAAFLNSTQSYQEQNEIINKVKSLLGITIKSGDVTVTVTAESTTVNDQITDAVTQKPAKKPRAPRKTTKKAD